MRFVCSRCHTHFDGDPEDEELACPNCKAEAGLEQVKEGTPSAMRYFGIVLALAGVFAIIGTLVGVLR